MLIFKDKSTGQKFTYEIQELAYYRKEISYFQRESLWVAKICVESVKSKFQDGNVDIWYLVKTFQTHKYAKQWADNIIETLKENRENYFNQMWQHVKEINLNNLDFVKLQGQENNLDFSLLHKSKKCNKQCEKCKNAVNSDFVI